MQHIFCVSHCVGETEIKDTQFRADSTAAGAPRAVTEAGPLVRVPRAGREVEKGHTEESGLQGMC